MEVNYRGICFITFAPGKYNFCLKVSFCETKSLEKSENLLNGIHEENFLMKKVVGGEEWGGRGRGRMRRLGEGES